MELGELINASRLLSADTQQLIDIFLRQAKLFKQVQINDSSSRTSHRKLVLQSKLAEQFALRAIVLDLSCYFGDNNTDINLNTEDDIDLLHQAAVVLIEKFNKEQEETGQSDEDKAMLLKPLLEALGSLTTFSPTVAKLLKFDQANAEKPESAPEEEKENKTDSSKKKIRSRPKKVSLDVQLPKTVPVSPVLDKADVSKIPKPAPTATPPPSPVNQVSSPPPPPPPPPVLSPALLPSTQSNPQPHSSVPLPISKRVGPRTVNPLNLSLIASPPPQQESANADVKPIIKEVWTHRDRLPENQADGHCFICRKSNPDSQCGKRFSNSTRCRTRFHLDCLKDYNAGDFDAEYLHDSFGSYVCPLHHCNVCWFERLKTSAVSGDLIQCKCCYRSFHEICQPAGFFIEKRVSVPQAESSGKVIQTRIDMTVCHSHAKDKDVLDKLKHNKQATHLPFCSECEEKGQKSKGDVLINCSECIRSYHPNCKRLSVKAIDGLRFSGDDRVCEACILGENIRPNQTIIAKYANSFYPGMVAPLAKYPAHCAVADKFGSRLGDAGFVAVEWSGCQNLFSLVPSRFIVPMFEGSFDLVGKRMTDKDIRLAWEKMDSNIIVPRPHMLNAYELNRHKEIKTSFYQSEDVKPKGRLIPEEDMLCECAESSGDGQGRCGENCSNRTISQQECPKTCEQKLGGCNNRTLSRSEVCKKVAVFKTEKKGIGVEAVEDIKKDEFIAEYAGEIISEAEFQRRSNESAAKRNDEEKHYIMVLREPKRYIDAKYYGNIARFINHSCEPNCRVEEITIAVDSKKKGKSALCTLDSRVAIFAKRNIQKGEELSFDYDMDELSEGTPLPPCYCGAPSCNGKLGKTKQEKLERRLKEEKKQQKVAKEENPKPKKTGRKRKAPVSDSADEIKKELKNEGKKVETRGRKRKNIIVANDVPVTVDASWPKMPISLPLPVLITVQKDAIVLPSAGSLAVLPPVARFSPFKMMAGRRKSSSRSPRKPITPVPVINAVPNDPQNHAKVHILQPSADGKRQRRSRRAFSPSPERPKPQAVSA